MNKYKILNVRSVTRLENGLVAVVVDVDGPAGIMRRVYHKTTEQTWERSQKAGFIVA